MESLLAKEVALILCVLIATSSAAEARGAGREGVCKAFYPIIAFGDSTTDTGNQVRSGGKGLAPAAHPPYGKTFFKRATGRYCDGRLMVDFLMSALKKPFLAPHLARTPHVESQNFAVAGATSLDVNTLQRIANVTSLTPESLDRQLLGFNFDTPPHATNLSNSLIYFGEIGGNDYNYALAARRPPKVIQSLLSPVIHRISSSLHSLLSRGVQHIVVQGQFPMGCISLYLKSLNGTKTDKNGCIKSVMQISDRHDRLLKDVVTNLTKLHKDAKIVFFDTTAAYVHILQNAAVYNFTNVHDPCYPAAFEMLTTRSTSPPQSANRVACPNPENYISWDGIHLTDAMYGTMMKLFLTDSKFSSPFPNFLTNCTKI